MTDKLWKGWKYWKNKTQLEEDAIDSMLKAKNYILKNIPKEEIVSIYVYGSFVRREMTKDSDVDLFVILKTKRHLGLAEKLTKKALALWKVRVGIFFLTLEELKTGERANTQKGKLPSPKIFIAGRFRKGKSLIYGKRLSFDEFQGVSNEKVFENELSLVKKHLCSIESHFYWRRLIRHLFRMIEIEQWVKGRDSPLKCRKMASLLGKEKPIIKKVVYYLLDTNPEEVGIKERKKFVKEAKKYINSSYYWYYRNIKNKSAFYAWKIVWGDPWIGYIGEKINKKSPKIYRLLKKIK